MRRGVETLSHSIAYVVKRGSQEETCACCQGPSVYPLELAFPISPYSIQLPRKERLGQTLVLPLSDRAEFAEVLEAKARGPGSNAMRGTPGTT